MKTLFATGFGNSRDVWYGRYPSGAFMGSSGLGEDYTTMDEGYRDRYLGKIGVYANKLQSMSSIIALAQSDPTTFRVVMGTDADAFLSNMYQAQSLYPSVQAVSARFQSDTPSQWQASASEMDNSENWTRLIDKMFALYQAHPQAAAARVQPGAMPQAPQPMILGIPQNTFLIGAGLAGLGLLAVALV